MAIFRSETMSRGTLIVRGDFCHLRELIYLLGCLRGGNGLMMDDMNKSSLNRSFRSYIKRIEEIEMMIGVLYRDLNIQERLIEMGFQSFPGMDTFNKTVNKPHASFQDKMDISLMDSTSFSSDIRTNTYDGFSAFSNTYDTHTNDCPSNIPTIDSVQADVLQIYKQHISIRENNNMMTERRRSLIEEKIVVLAAIEYYETHRTAGLLLSPESAVLASPLNNGKDVPQSKVRHIHISSSGIRLSIICGILELKNKERFRRSIFRCSLGNAYTEFFEADEAFLSEPQGESLEYNTDICSGIDDIKKSTVFICWFQGTSLLGRIEKLCMIYSTKLYEWPETLGEAKRKLISIDEMLVDKGFALQAYDVLKERELEQLLRLGNMPTLVTKSILHQIQCCLDHKVFSVISGGQLPLIVRVVVFCGIEKGIYTTLNGFRGQTTLRCDCWFRTPSAEFVQLLVATYTRIHSGDSLKISGYSQMRGASSDGSGISAMLLSESIKEGHGGQLYHGKDGGETVPTFFNTNCITIGIQDVVDTYGIPSYKEVNPAILGVVTFPFIFGTMFGDAGHAWILLIFGLWLCNCSPYVGTVLDSYTTEFNEDNRKSAINLSVNRGRSIWQNITYRFQKNKIPRIPKIFSGIHKYRFLIVSMGAFGLFSGIIYGEFFGVGIHLLGSRWTCFDEGECIPDHDTKNIEGSYGPYIFGLDPAWKQSTNELTFVNSMKMKLSLVIGLTQMAAGLFLRILNHKRNLLDFLCVCIPMILFFFSVFGYMGYLIIYKWVNYYEGPTDGIINILIGLVIGNSKSVVFVPLLEGQNTTHTHLKFIASISVVCLLIAKPLAMYITTRRSASYSTELQEQHDETTIPLVSSSGEWHSSDTPSFRRVDINPEISFSDIIVHQIIETIEFVLGSVSHVASYLRIWALSLAHQQLSLVFMNNLLIPFMESGNYFTNPIYIYFGFILFLIVTIGVLLGMDVLECFLHTLRLHWVEFQSKFYKGTGIKFDPYSQETVIEDLYRS